MGECNKSDAANDLPAWVPKSVQHYLAHTESGCSIRELARSQECHPSTILRQVRKLEQRRDDPLVDDALRALCTKSSDQFSRPKEEAKTMPTVTPRKSEGPYDGLTQDRIDQESRRILLRLCEPGAVLAVARDMETAVIVRENSEHEAMRTAVVDRDIAQALALKGWISCSDTATRVTRYTISAAGRTALQKLMARVENTASGFRDNVTKFDAKGTWDTGAFESNMVGQVSRQYMTESPLVGLARRRDRNGQMFLMREFVAVGERLREDFELAKMGSALPKDIAAFMKQPPNEAAPRNAASAHERVQSALRDLGPGLADVAYHCCCLLEGLEVTEKAMGWSARSGKIVLRIALQRLKRHYEEQGKFGPMIG